jgi:hypothetical protein
MTTNQKPLTKCKHCKRDGVTCLDLQIHVLEPNGIDVLIDRRWRGECTDCFDSLSKVVHWYSIDSTRAVGIYLSPNTVVNPKTITEEIIQSQ